MALEIWPKIGLSGKIRLVASYSVIHETLENGIQKIMIDKLVHRFEILNHLIGLNQLL